ncbi:class I SAM-dependent methyltransferase family protein [Methanothermobacter sp. EMTCatA1]|uniref:class I SAM-dependent methyltransferase n=1 Tax=Methanothermobacter sp. EMTCatA1 TaxID=2017966 RepID=UPI000B6178A8|nr:class I SAM-dependent methyltransferase family protein [Methanothermobacter sp. EMTCatA1]BAZ99848.1 Ribosomal protein L11 methyltransferase [Methanothermobacter sp. EMTCatA1]
MKGLKVPKKMANDIIKMLVAGSLLNRDYRISRDHEHVYIPLREDARIPEIDGAEIVDQEFKESKRSPAKFTDILKSKIPEDALASIRRSFDIIGDTVILEIPEELHDYRFIIGEAALEFTGRKAVYMKRSGVKGVTRTRELELIAGSPVSETIHQEYGSRIKVDIKEVYFSPRLANERETVAAQVKDGEVVLDMFAGAGPFAIAVARHGRASRIYAVDINPAAVRYIEENARLNHAEDVIVAVEGDVREFLRDRECFADHIIMNLPGSACEFIDDAIRAVRDGGVIHYYEFARDFKTPVNRLKEAARPFHVEVLDMRRVKSRSPGVWHMGIDARIRKSASSDPEKSEKGYNSLI